eukprot:1160480-Pelagomonas_calceolata.AAC.6
MVHAIEPWCMRVWGCHGATVHACQGCHGACHCALVAQHNVLLHACQELNKINCTRVRGHPG